MSSAAHAIQRRPYLRTDQRSPACVAPLRDDGSMVLTRDELTIFGDGDPARGAREIRLMIANERDRAINEKPQPRSASASVRLGRPTDEDAIYELLKLDIAENAAIVAPGNEEDIRATIKQALTKPNIVGLIETDGKPVAVVMLLCMKWWFSKAWYYQEIPMFVHPEHRKSDHARQLIAFQRYWVDEMTRAFGYRVHLLCGVLGTKRIRAKTSLYRRIFRQCGSVFIYPSPFIEGS